MRLVLSCILNLPNAMLWLLDQGFLNSRLLKICLIFLLLSQVSFSMSEPLDGVSQTPWVSLPASLVKQDKRIVFGCSIPSESKYYKLGEDFYRKLFKQLGYGFKMIAMPRGREVAELLNNNLDGTCGRRKDAPHPIFSTLERLPMPIIVLSYELLSRDPYPDIRYLDELPAGKILAYVRGGAVAQDILDKQLHINVFKVLDAEVGIKMLAGGRVDFFFGISASINDVLSRLEFKHDIHRKRLAEKHEIFTYLIPSRKYMVESMADAMLLELKLLNSDYLFEL